MSHSNMTRKMKVILASLSVIMISVVLTACGGSKKYDSKKPVANQVDKHINGIEAGAGEMTSTRNALKSYGLQNEGWQLQSSSTAAMTSQLDKAYRMKKPIVVTGWQPHWMFKKYNLKLLQDPKNQYGKAEHIETVTHKGFKQKNPGAYKMLSQFHWTPSNMSDVMMKTNGGEDPAKAAQEFINNNPKLFNKWASGVPKGHGQEVRLTNVSWDSEIASTNVVAQALDKMGYKATISTLEPEPMYIALSKGSADATVSSWLPLTHGQYVNQYKNNYDFAGENLQGAQTGLVVPKYMNNVNSINDLAKK